MDLDVVIVNWNGGAELVRAVRSARRFGGRPIVVDNASTSGALDEVAAMDGVRVVRMSKNRGFAVGCNAGAAVGTAEALLFLNPDAEIVEGRLSDLFGALAVPPEAFGAGEPRIVGVRLVDGQGRRVPSWREAPTTRELVLVLLRIDAMRRRLRARRDDPGDTPGAATRTGGLADSGSSPNDGLIVHRNGYIVGAAFAIARRDWQRFGGLDEGFFLWAEEVDLCQRLLAAGGTLIECPAILVRHQGAVSWNRLSRLRRQRLHIASTRRYASRNLGPHAVVAVLACVPAALAIGVTLDVVHALIDRVAAGRGSPRRVRRRG